MPRTRTPARRTTLVALPALLALLAPAPAAPAAGADGGPTLEPHRFETRNHGEVDAELGRLSVPENRRRLDTSSGSREIGLAFVRLPAHPGAQAEVPPGVQPPPLVYLAGGPGGSGIDAGRGARFPLFDALRRRGDVILFDQRGTGESDGPQEEECDEEALYPLDRPLELEPYLAMVEEVAAACARSWRDAGVDLDAYTTEDSVADLEDLRRALGAERIDLLGISYGSQLAMAYLRAHPDRVRRVVLAGVEGPDHTVKLPSQYDRQLDALDELLAASGSGESIRESVGEVLDRLERRPVTVRIVEVEGPDRERHLVIGRRDLAAITLSRLQDPGGMVQLPALYRRLAEGDFTDVAGEVLGLRRIGGLEAMPEAMDAASGISPDRLERLKREDRTTLLGSGVLLANLATIRGLGVRDLGEGFRGPLTVDVPALLVSGSLDGRTPASNAEALLPGFRNGRHLVVRNGGHGDDLLVATPELREEIVGFFLDRPPGEAEIEVPPPDPAASRRRMPLTPEQAARYVGEYERREREIWRILHHETIETLDAEGRATHSSAVLQIRWNGNGFPLHPVSEESFYIDFFWFAGDDFTFVFDDSGAVEAMVINPGRDDEIRLPKVH